MSDSKNMDSPNSREGWLQTRAMLRADLRAEMEIEMDRRFSDLRQNLLKLQRYAKLADVAAALGMTADAVHKQIQAGTFPITPLNKSRTGHYRFEWSAIDTYLASKRGE